MSDVLRVEALTVRFAGLTAVSGVRFRVAPGEVCAVIGPNGAGKSTLFNAIGGYVRLAGGSVAIDGTDVTGWPVHRIAQAGVRRTFQNGGLFRDLTVLENVLAGMHQSAGTGLVAAMLATRSARRGEGEAIARARAIMGTMGIGALEQIRVRDLASGQQRMVEITRALATEARLLMLDEPAVGLTAAECVLLDGTLRRLAASGIAVLLVEHVLDLVMSVSDKVIVLNYGEMLAQGTPRQVREDPAVLDVYLGQA